MTGIETRRHTKTGRFYEIIPGKPYPSVTTIEQVIAKPALIPWAAKVERLAVMAVAADMYEEMSKPMVAKGSISREVYMSLLESRIGKAKAGQKEMEAAGEVGTQAHNMIEWHIRQQLGFKAPQPKICDKALWAFMAFEDWAKSVDLLPIRSEQVVFSHKYEYAGTMDLLAYIRPERKIALVDFKTGKAVYPESSLQLCSYRAALIEMGLETADECWVLRLPKVETDPEFEPKQVMDFDLHFKAFLAARDLWQWQFDQNHKEGK